MQLCSRDTLDQPWIRALHERASQGVALSCINPIRCRDSTSRDCRDCSKDDLDAVVHDGGVWRGASRSRAWRSPS
jgi:hypothetical protein